MAKKNNENKTKKLNELDFDDDDLDFGDLVNVFAEPPPPANKREAVVRSIKDVGSGIAETITDSPTEFGKRFLKEALPASFGSDISRLESVTSDIKDEFKSALVDVRKNGRIIMRAIDDKLPKEGFGASVVSAINKLIGPEEEARSQMQSAEDRISERISGDINNLLGAQKTDVEQKQLLFASIENKRSFTQIELQRHSITYLERLHRFNVTVVNAYMRKSLELDYRNYFIAKEQLDINKVAIDSFKNQFESIILNTALPDVVKMRKSEAFRAITTQRVINDYLENSRLFAGIKKKISGGLRSAQEGIASATGIVDQASMFGSSGASVSKSNLAGGMLGDVVSTLVARKAGEAFGSSNTGAKVLGGARNFFTDPSEFFMAQSEKGGLFSRAFNALSRLTRDTSTVNRFELEKASPREAAYFDNRTRTSIVKVIPGLLSKIHQEIAHLRSGKDEGEIRYDYTTDRFMTAKETKEVFKKRVNRTILTGGASQAVDNIIKLFLQYVKGGFPSVDVSNIKKGITAYIISGKSVVPDRLERNGFLSFFSPSVSKKMKEGLDKLLSEKDPKRRYENITELARLLAQVRQTLPSPNAIISEYADSGNLEVLSDADISKTDIYTGRTTLNTATYEKMLGEILGKDVSTFGVGATNTTNHPNGPGGLSAGDPFNLNDVAAKVKNSDIGGIKNKFSTSDGAETIRKVATDTTNIAKSTGNILHDNVKDALKKELNIDITKETDRFKDIVRDVAKNTKDEIEEVRTRLKTAYNIDVRGGINTGRVRNFSLDTMNRARSMSFTAKFDDITGSIKNNSLGTKFDNAKNGFSAGVKSIEDKVEIMRDEIANRVGEIDTSVAVNGFVAHALKQVEAMRNIVDAAPHLNINISGMVSDIVARLRNLTTIDVSDKLKIHNEVSDIVDRMKAMAGSVTPPEGAFKARRREAETTSVDDAIEEESLFFRAVNSDDPVGYITREMRRKTLSGVRKLLFGGAKGIFTFAKNAVINDLKRGKKLREWLMKDGILKRSANSVLKKFATKKKNKSDDDDDETMLDEVGNIAKNAFKKDRAVSEALFKTMPSIIKSAVNSTMKSFGSAVFGKSKKTNRFDSDGDGLREGSWLERLKDMAAKKKEKNDKTAAADKNATDDKEEDGGLKTGTVLAALAGIVAIAKKMYKGITSFVPDLLKGFGSMFSGMITKTLGSFGSIFSKFTKLGGAGLSGATKIAKGAGGFLKSLSKKIPGISLLAGAGYAAKELYDGNFSRAGAEMLSGVLGTVPGFGTAASMAVDAWLIKDSFTDANKDMTSPSDEEGSVSYTAANNPKYKTPQTLLSRGGQLYSGHDILNYVSLRGRDVDVLNMNPAVLNQLGGMAKEYYEITGKPLPINSAFRSKTQQLALRRKMGSRAATPGRSLHEFGLAFDTNSSAAAELDKLGLLRKYGFTLPVGKEGWHIEPAGIQIALEDSKRNAALASELTEKAVGRGGGGWGTEASAGKYSRNSDYQKRLLEAKTAFGASGAISVPVPVVDTQDSYSRNDKVSKTASEADASFKNVVGIGTNAEIGINTTAVKLQGRTAELTSIMGRDINNISSTLLKSLDVQRKMLDAMNDIASYSREISKKDMIVNVEQPVTAPANDVAARRVEEAHKPKVNLERKKYG